MKILGSTLVAKKKGLIVLICGLGRFDASGGEKNKTTEKPAALFCLYKTVTRCVRAHSFWLRVLLLRASATVLDKRASYHDRGTTEAHEKLEGQDQGTRTWTKRAH
jgi:hypothetical protein